MSHSLKIRLFVQENELFHDSSWHQWSYNEVGSASFIILALEMGWVENWSQCFCDFSPCSADMKNWRNWKRLFSFSIWFGITLSPSLNEWIPILYLSFCYSFLPELFSYMFANWRKIMIWYSNRCTKCITSHLMIICWIHFA
mgnify:CR=1 FL=1